MKINQVSENLYFIDNVLDNIEIIQKHVLKLNDQAAFTYDNVKIKGGLYLYNDKLLGKIHQMLWPELKKLQIFDNLFPTYNFLIQYLPGTQLPLHTDREQCKVNLSLCLIGSGEIEVEGYGAFEIKENQALIYLGQVPHSRKNIQDYLCTCVFHFSDVEEKEKL